MLRWKQLFRFILMLLHLPLCMEEFTIHKMHLVYTVACNRKGIQFTLQLRFYRASMDSVACSRSTSVVEETRCTCIGMNTFESVIIITVIIINFDLNDRTEGTKKNANTNTFSTLVSLCIVSVCSCEFRWVYECVHEGKVAKLKKEFFSRRM